MGCVGGYCSLTDIDRYQCILILTLILTCKLTLLFTSTIIQIQAWTQTQTRMGGGGRRDGQSVKEESQCLEEGLRHVRGCTTE